MRGIHISFGGIHHKSAREEVIGPNIRVGLISIEIPFIRLEIKIENCKKSLLALKFTCSYLFLPSPSSPTYSEVNHLGFNMLFFNFHQFSQREDREGEDTTKIA